MVVAHDTVLAEVAMPDFKSSLWLNDVALIAQLVGLILLCYLLQVLDAMGVRISWH